MRIEFALTTIYQDGRDPVTETPAKVMDLVPRIGECVVWKDAAFEVVAVDWRIDPHFSVAVVAEREDDTGAGE